MSEYVEIGAALITQTDDAYCFDVGEYEDAWIPRSVCGEIDEQSGTVEVEEWFAHEKGLI